MLTTPLSSADYGLVVLMLILGLGLYPLFLRGWSSFRTYAIVGGLRGVAQTISYEISLAFLLLSLFIIRKTIRVNQLGRYGQAVGLLLIPPLAALWLIRAVAETNRTPFDFAEGESELVSGFNIEYGAGGFALLFIAEYGRILLLRLITRMVVGRGNLAFPAAILLTVLVSFF